MFLTQINSDAYVPLAQTSITSAYANGAQATYGRRCGGFDTDELRYTQMNADIFYLCLIRVYHRSSVFICGFLLFCQTNGRLRRIIDCVKKWREAQMKWTKTDGRQARDTKYTLCGRPKGVQYKIRTTVDFSDPLAVSLFCRATTTCRHFFHKQFYVAEPCYLGLTQMDTDALRWDTNNFLFIIRVSSVLIPVHLWFLAGERLRLIIDCM